MVALVDRPPDSGAPVSFGDMLARSARFKALFAEGMDLVEEAATYLDGPGRADAKALPPELAAAYSAESMRLTTRLMQVASWLLIRRSILDGDAPQPEGAARFKLTAQAPVATPATFVRLPARLQGLTTRSLRLQTRILHLDTMMSEAPAPRPAANAPGAQLALLRAAFAR